MQIFRCIYLFSHLFMAEKVWFRNFIISLAPRRENRKLLLRWFVQLEKFHYGTPHLSDLFFKTKVDWRETRTSFAKQSLIVIPQNKPSSQLGSRRASPTRKGRKKYPKCGGRTAAEGGPRPFRSAQGLAKRSRNLLAILFAEMS